MNRSKAFRWVALVLIGATFTSCGKDSTGPNAVLDQATSIEIFSLLVTQVLTLGFGAFSVVPAGADTELPVEIAFNVAAADVITETVPCDGGGNVVVTGTFTSNVSNQGTGSYGFDIRQRPNNCRLGTSQGVFTVNGNPDFHITANVTYNGWSPVSYVATYNGGYTWSGRGGTGGCAMNLTYNFSFANPQQTTMTGSMCGYTF